MISPKSAEWVDPVYFVGTYFLTALLIWWERDHLADFHLDILVLILFILGKPLEAFFFGLQDDSYACIFIALGLSLALIFSRPRLPKLTARTWGWLLIGILGGMALAVYFAKIFGIYYPARAQVFSWSEAKYATIQQMLSAGLAEEPLFRGFLWGCLRKMGLKDLWIWLIQAGLFWLGHAYAFLYAPYSFWLIVPIGGLVLGLLAWRSRSIAPSIIAHGFANGLSQFIK